MARDVIIVLPAVAGLVLKRLSSGPFNLFKKPIAEQTHTVLAQQLGRISSLGPGGDDSTYEAPHPLDM